MITFRYHLVSVAAILIALAAGIALGSGPLDETGDTLRGTAAPTTADPAVQSFEDGFAGRTAPSLLAGRLKGQSVVVLSVPGANPAEVTGVVNDLQLAGAEVTGHVELTGKILDSASRQFAEGVAQQVAADVPEVSGATDSYGRIGAALARSFMAKEPAAVDATAGTIRSAFVEGGLVTMTKPPEQLANLAILVAGPQRSGAADQSTVIAALAAAHPQHRQGCRRRRPVVLQHRRGSGQGRARQRLRLLDLDRRRHRHPGGPDRDRPGGGRPDRRPARRLGHVPQPGRRPSPVAPAPINPGRWILNKTRRGGDISTSFGRMRLQIHHHPGFCCRSTAPAGARGG